MAEAAIGGARRHPLRGVRGVHFDVTDLCNAGCPQCARTDPEGCKPQSWLPRQAMGLAAFEQAAPPSFLKRLSYAYFCGNLGDPIVAPDLIAMLEHCWAANPELDLRVFTNGSVRDLAWWRALAQVSRERRFRLIAAIDGASEETNRLYRVRTEFSRTIRNVTTFIRAGGEAEWRMILFKHNEHERDVAERMAQVLGFSGFKAYPSNRFFGRASMTYRHRDETATLEPPSGTHQPKAQAIETPLGTTASAPLHRLIQCESLKGEEIFIDFLGNLLPCCHVGLRYLARRQGVADFGADPALSEAFESFDMARLNVGVAGFEAALAGLQDFLIHLERYWDRDEPRVCKRVCGRMAATP